ncbi:hypothetical protein [Candidatus Mycalebacterium sp.]
MRRVLFSFFVLVVLSMSQSVQATQPADNAEASGIKTCAKKIRENTAIFLEGQPHVSHDFVAPGGKRNVDKRPFFSMAFRDYSDVGLAHLSIVATRSDMSRKNTKCDVQINETFASERKSCEVWSLDLSKQKFEALPLAPEITLMENKGGDGVFSFYYLTSINNGNGCLVSRRVMSYDK